MDIHRVFAEAVMLEDGTVRRLGRIGIVSAGVMLPRSADSKFPR